MEYGCIGEHLKHSFSKEIHDELADYDYEILEITRENLKGFFDKREFKAINVTIPYKQEIIPFLDEISPEAKSINAVNTVVNRDGKLYGYNTDFYGLKALIERKNVTLKDKKVLVLGSGGTSNTAVAVAGFMGAKKVIKVSRTAKDGYVTYEDVYEKYTDFEIIINTTPCGMFPNIGASAVDLSRFNSLEAVFDAVYNPLKSKLICDAKKLSVVSSGGLYMLVSQAAYAVEKFIDTPVDNEKVETIFKNLYKDKMNIVLVGMPGSGKTSVGNYLSQKLSKSFVDTDDLIVESQKKSIPEIFSEVGEVGFRGIEKNEVFAVSSQNNHIIATGGGVILNKDNTDILKENGRIYFIDRPLEMLVATDDRPLSRDNEALQKRYNERYAIYLECADAVIDGSGTIETVAKRIEAEFNEYSCD